LVTECGFHTFLRENDTVAAFTEALTFICNKHTFICNDHFPCICRLFLAGGMGRPRKEPSFLPHCGLDCPGTTAFVQLELQWFPRSSKTGGSEGWELEYQRSPENQN
jgi:hypothetical protein